jgi:hypothetical protein
MRTYRKGKHFLVIWTLLTLISFCVVGCSIFNPSLLAKEKEKVPGKIILPEAPRLNQIEGYKVLKSKETWTAPEGGGVAFGKDGFEALRYRDELRDYYVGEVTRKVENHNKAYEDWYKSLK